ncbi:MAG: nucleoside hydrolase [Planctomycetota bacterium]|nr:nucleoside hydrolase [Planctomycetota bacterium]
MENLNRRQLMGLTAAGLAASIPTPERAYTSESERRSREIPVLHVTDLFRPHMDPDDHWDLACVYALAYRGDIDLKGILIDYPLGDGGGRNPDTAAVAQMNFITGRAVPVAVGSSLPLKSRNDMQTYASPTDHHGVKLILDVLRKSPRPVVINILGQSRDVAIAGKKAPDLFASKCAAIYLNAGTGTPTMNSASKLEYNVTLDKFAYAAIFDLPCPIYWMPCFEDMETRRQRDVREYGTHYKFRQSDILPHLSDMVQNYFAYMFGRYTDHNWLGYLKGQKDKALLSKFAGMDRHIWCTGGFLHAAGYTVSRDGKIVPFNEGRDSSIFTFDAVRVTCGDDGVTRWRQDDTSRKRFMFHVQDRDNYQSAMTKAMKSLLTELP